MDPKQLEQLCECLERAVMRGNLVPGRLVHTEAALGGADVQIPLAKYRGENTRAFSIEIKCRDLLDGNDAGVLQYLVSTDEVANATARLADGQGQYLLQGAERVHAAPAWAQELRLHTAGVASTDFSTENPTVVFTVHVYEMVSVEEQERC